MLNAGIALYGHFNSEVYAVVTPNSQDIILPSERLDTLKIDFDKFQQLYYYYDDTQILRLWLETWSLISGEVCDEDTLFRLRPTQGVYVNMTEVGFRPVSPQGPWPPDDKAYNVFFFGGSTAFGLGVADNLTVAAWLQDHIRRSTGSDAINVYNFGAIAHASLQERWRFEALVRDGHIPDLAIFLDGMNDFDYYRSQLIDDPDVYCEPPLDNSMRWDNTLACRHDEMCLPMQRLAITLGIHRNPETRTFAEMAGVEIAPEAPVDDEAANRLVIERWLDNKQAIEILAAEHSIQTLFVKQPVPIYAYDLQYHAFADSPEALGGHVRPMYGYPLWEAMANNPDATWTDNFVDLSRLGEDNTGPIYITLTHYTSDFSNEIAQAINDVLIERGIIE